MTPDDRFLSKRLDFWASIRTISQEVGYTVRRKKIIKVPTIEEMVIAFERLGLDTSKLLTKSRTPNKFAREMLAYFQHRADVLNNCVEPLLMDAEEAKRTFKSLKKKFNPACPLPMNKQKGNKRAEAYFTCIINMFDRGEFKRCYVRL